MKERDESNLDDASLELPKELHADLRELFDLTPTVGVNLDAAILSEAKAGYERRLRFRPFLRRATLVGSIAAVLLVTFMLVSIMHRTPTRLAQTGDVNRDGHVNILDAMLVAKTLADGGRPDSAWDVNRDGVVDQKDVDWIAATAVNVSGAGGRQ